MTRHRRRARLQQAGIEIVRPNAKEPNYGFPSFFVRAPNGVLIELRAN